MMARVRKATLKHMQRFKFTKSTSRFWTTLTVALETVVGLLSNSYLEVVRKGEPFNDMTRVAKC